MISKKSTPVTLAVPSLEPYSRRRSLFRVIGVIVGVLICLVIVVMMVAIFTIWYSEKQREKMLTSYEIPSEIFEKISSVEHASISELMGERETMACAINGYGDVQNVASFLSEKQQVSLPKSKLPSEDMAWYLLFFTADSVSRIYLVDSGKLEGGLAGGGAGCINRDGYFEVRKAQHPNGESYFVLHLMNERKKQ